MLLKLIQLMPILSVKNLSFMQIFGCKLLFG